MKIIERLRTEIMKISMTSFNYGLQAVDRRHNTMRASAQKTEGLKSQFLGNISYRQLKLTAIEEIKIDQTYSLSASCPTPGEKLVAIIFTLPAALSLLSLL